MSARTPVVTIALGVRNGAAFLAAAFESVLAQTYGDWELVIGDNASTDGTAEICHAHAATDERIRYIRHIYDLGAAVNYNVLQRMGRGLYQRLLSHDDVLPPDWLYRTVRALDIAPPHVIGVHTGVEVIDTAGQYLRTPPPELMPRLDGHMQAERFAEAILVRHNCYPIFALYRREALQRARAMPAFDGGDRALIAELALLGPLAYLDDTTWQNRDHNGRYVRAVRPHPATSQTWWDADAREPIAHHWRLFRHYLRSVRQHAETRQHARCMATLARWWATDWNAARVALDAVGTQMPEVFEVVQTMKRSRRERSA